jgi:hypothetical protein
VYCDRIGYTARLYPSAVALFARGGALKADDFRGLPSDFFNLIIE